MSTASEKPSNCAGQIVLCVKLHEGGLRLIREGISQSKRDGSQERVNEYCLKGKLRPAIVLCLVCPPPGELRSQMLLVWYTRTSAVQGDGAIDVSQVTRPIPPKRAYLRPHREEFRCVPNTSVWCPKVIGRLDPTIFAGYLEIAQKADGVPPPARGSTSTFSPKSLAEGK